MRTALSPASSSCAARARCQRHVGHCAQLVASTTIGASAGPAARGGRAAKQLPPRRVARRRARAAAAARGSRGSALPRPRSPRRAAAGDAADVVSEQVQRRFDLDRAGRHARAARRRPRARRRAARAASTSPVAEAPDQFLHLRPDDVRVHTDAAHTAELEERVARGCRRPRRGRAPSSTIRRAWSRSAFACLTAVTFGISASSAIVSGSMLITHAAGNVVRRRQARSVDSRDGVGSGRRSRAAAACCSTA